VRWMMWPVSHHPLHERLGGIEGDQPRLAHLLVVDDADGADPDRVAERVGLLDDLGRGDS
jgi:hypothetical protein